MRCFASFFVWINKDQEQSVACIGLSDDSFRPDELQYIIDYVYTN